MMIKRTNLFNCFIIILLLNLITNSTISQSNNMFLGMVNCSGKFWVDEIPVTVDSWISYYNWIKINKGIEAANKVLPDSTKTPAYIWEYINIAIDKETKGLVSFLSPQTGQPKTNIRKCPELMSQSVFLKTLKIRTCRLGYFPITGVTYEQVVEFCRWRTENSGKSTVIYELSDINEWKEIVLSGLSESEKLNGITDSTCGKKSNCAAFNYRKSKEYDDYTSWGEDGSSLKPVGMFSPNPLGVYDLFGNVSEMTEEKGIGVGGNFQLYANQCHIDSLQLYSKPELWLGFRCIVKIE